GWSSAGTARLPLPGHRGDRMRLAGKVAMITGAAQGLGAVYAKALAAEGATVVLCDVQDPTRTTNEISAGGGRAVGFSVDITDEARISGVTAEVAEKFGTIHVLINNAALMGTLEMKPFEKIKSEEWDRVMQVNVRGSFECVRAVAPFMRQQKYGKIINI